MVGICSVLMCLMCVSLCHSLPFVSLPFPCVCVCVCVCVFVCVCRYAVFASLFERAVDSGGVGAMMVRTARSVAPFGMRTERVCV